jgi:membrane fusion protein (multidrug efflux system)
MIRSGRNDLSSAPTSDARREAPDMARGLATSLKGEAGRTAAPQAAPVAAAEQPVAAPKKRSRKRLVLLALLAIALIGGGYFGYDWWTNGRFLVSTDDAYVGADVTILAAKASGYVTAVEVENNESVRAGQVIARIDDVDYKLALKAAQDKVATQAASVDRIARQIEAAEAQARQAEPQIAAARAEAVRTASDYERQNRLSQSDFASKARLEQSLADRDRAAANLQVAEAGLAAARANVAVLKAQKDEAERVTQEYRTAAARAERDLSFTIVRAPVSGVLGNRAVEVGAYVQPGSRLAALVPLDSVRVDANFKETQLRRIRAGQRVHVEVDAFPGREFEGTVESIAPASGSQFSLLPPENATGNFTKIVQRVPVRIKVGGGEEAVLRPGMSVVVRVDTRDRKTAQAGR